MRIQTVRPDALTINQKIRKSLDFYFRYYIVCHGNTISYLRKQGAVIGEGCSIGCGIAGFGTEPWLIEIGNRVTLTPGVCLLTHDGSSRLFRSSLPESSRYGNRFGTIRIHDECFVGINSIILPDVEIGPRSIVGAGSVVSKNVPPNMVFAGVPAKKICSLDDYIEGYKRKMIPLSADNRADLRRELTEKLWGEIR